MQNPLKKKSGKLFTGISVASVAAITAALIIPTLTASAVNVPANSAGGTSISSSAVTTQSTANSETETETENENSVEEATTIDASQVKLTEAQTSRYRPEPRIPMRQSRAINLEARTGPQYMN